jgi:hypothetical protein
MFILSKWNDLYWTEDTHKHTDTYRWMYSQWYTAAETHTITQRYRHTHTYRDPPDTEKHGEIKQRKIHTAMHTHMHALLHAHMHTE